MKKLIAALLLAVTIANMHSQVRIGIKGGVNFADLDGKLNASTRTGFHAGAVLELKSGNIALQPELMYSMQGAKIDVAGVKDINFSYVTVPVLVKYYLISDTFSIEAGPQFSFLIDDNQVSNSVASAYETKSFDFAALGGAGLNITKSLFVQARYVVGLTDASVEAFTNEKAKNRVIQLSVGLMF